MRGYHRCCCKYVKLVTRSLISPTEHQFVNISWVFVHRRIPIPYFARKNKPTSIDWKLIPRMVEQEQRKKEESLFENFRCENCESIIEGDRGKLKDEIKLEIEKWAIVTRRNSTKDRGSSYSTESLADEFFADGVAQAGQNRLARPKRRFNFSQSGGCLLFTRWNARANTGPASVAL